MSKISDHGIFPTWIGVLLLAAVSGYSSELGFLGTLHCGTPSSLAKGDSTLGLGFPHRLKVRLGEAVLVPERDYRLIPDSQAIVFPFSETGDERLCLEIYHSPIFPGPTYVFYRKTDIPIFRDTLWEAMGVSGKSGGGEEALQEASPYQLRYGGNKSIGVSLGGEGGLRLDQSLLLDVEGQIAENVYIKGHLSDQEIPIQPEGNSATLREVDQIYVKVYGRGYAYTLGDHLFQFGEPGVDGYVANVQGLDARLQKGPYRGGLGYSASRGKFNSYSFPGQFGKQTGYFLTGDSGEGFVTVLAGTEKIWRNGSLLQRGQDYQIEYGEGRVDFLTPLIVSGSDQFTVEFQYTDRNYPAQLYSFSVGDSAGRFTWEFRGITENEDKEKPESFVPSSEDFARFENAGDSGTVRTTGLQTWNQDIGWVAGLYYAGGAGEWIHVPESAFDSLMGDKIPLYSVYFSPSLPGSYAPGQDQNGLRYYFFSPGGGFDPGEGVPLPTRRSHLTFGLHFLKPDSLKTGHSSSLYFLGSGLDRNLYSSRGDEDNHGYGLAYKGEQSFGRPIEEFGWGRWFLRSWIETKNSRYESFKQVIEPYGYREMWNLPSRFGLRGFTSQRYQIEQEIFSAMSYGGEYGYFEGMDTRALQSEKAVSERWKAFHRWGQGTRRLESFTEMKKALRGSGSYDNYRSAAQGVYQWNLFTPELKLSSEENIQKPGQGPLGKSLDRELESALHTALPGDRINLLSKLHIENIASNYNGQANQFLDSLFSWDISQKIELVEWGPWQSDLFASYQKYQQKDIPLASSAPRENDFRLWEWNNRLQDHRKGYTAYLNYRINQTVDVPLIEVYFPVGEGNGTHVCDTLMVGGREILECRPDSDRGNMEFAGLRRDSLSRGVGIQELDWSGNVSLSPAKWFQHPYGLLADLYFQLRFQFSNKQDSSSEAGIMPLFTDSQIKRVFEGKSRLQPVISWRPEGGTRHLQLSLEREFFATRIQYRLIESLFRQSLEWNQDLTDRLNYVLRQSYSRRQRNSEIAASSDSSGTHGLGGDLRYRIFRYTQIIPILDYEYGKGIAEATQALAGTGQSFALHSLFPRLRAEREMFTSGRVFSEYGINNIWGRGNGVERLRGNRRGITHRWLTGIDLQIGRYIFATGNYLVRREPGREKLFQNLSLEMRAIF